MAERVHEVMTPHPVSLPASTNIVDAARRMRDDDIGDVFVVDDDQLRGVVTDRDVVVRAVAEGRDPSHTTLGEVCSAELVTVAPDDTIDEAVELMSTHAVRRLPVVDGGRPVGVISIGDLAIDLEPGSALADISAARGNR